jgi:hypothetical protein
MNRYLILILLAAATSPVGSAVPTIQPILKTWRGVNSRAYLLRLAPRNNFIDNQRDFNKLWRSWGPSVRPPAVDFTKRIVVVVAEPGVRDIRLNMPRDEQGDLRLEVTSTQRGGAGFGYLMAVINRANVNSIEGVDLNSSDDAIQVSVIGSLEIKGIASRGNGTGIEITAKQIVFEVDFGGSTELEQAAKRYEGGRVLIIGDLERIPGVRQGGGWIIHANDIQRIGPRLMLGNR